MRAPLWIKVCGLRTAEAIEAAADAGVQAVGFVFHPDSPRNVGPMLASELATRVPPGIEKVAVFRHPSQALLEAAVDAIAPDWVQTDADDFARLQLPTGPRRLPVLRTGAAVDVAAQAGAMPERRWLLESLHSGAGERADWSAAWQLARRGEVLLAGGLHAGNVADAIAAVRPFGVDVSSGVERVRGVKDAALIREFVDAARAAHARIPVASAQESTAR